MVALGVAAAFMFSCESEDEVMQPINEGSQPGEADLPHFDQSNSTAIPWDELPAELKEATPVEVEESFSPENARTSAVGFSHSIGVWGGTGGGGFQILPLNPDDQFYAIGIRAGRYVDQIKVWYQRSNGTIYYQGSAGGNGGNYYIQFFAPDEYITTIFGRSGRFLDRIGFVTTKKAFNYGGNGGEYFYSSVSSKHKINGIFGRSGNLIDQIGCYVFFR